MVLVLLRNEAQRRLRAVWRICIQLTLFFVVLLANAILMHYSKIFWPLRLVADSVYLVGSIAVLMVMAKHIDKRKFADYGLRINKIWLADLLFGLLLGVFLIAAVTMSMFVLGWIEISKIAVTNMSVPFILAIILKFSTIAVAGICEEMTFRGYQLLNLSEGLLRRSKSRTSALTLSLAISSLIFGSAHLFNENATIVSTVFVAIAGIIIGLPYLLTGQLGLSIGFHVAWNYLLGTIMGYPVSGQLSGTHLFTVQQSGPDIFTGGSFGPEGGLLALGWAIVVCGLMLLWVKMTRKHIAISLGRC